VEKKKFPPENCFFREGGKGKEREGQTNGKNVLFLFFPHWPNRGVGVGTGVLFSGLGGQFWRLGGRIIWLQGWERFFWGFGWGVPRGKRARLRGGTGGQGGEDSRDVGKTKGKNGKNKRKKGGKKNPIQKILGEISGWGGSFSNKNVEFFFGRQRLFPIFGHTVGLWGFGFYFTLFFFRPNSWQTISLKKTWVWLGEKFFVPGPSQNPHGGEGPRHRGENFKSFIPNYDFPG